MVESFPICMNNQPQSSPQNSLNLLAQTLNYIRLVWRLMLDQRVPWALKIIPIITLIYVISPVDLIPDLIPGLGQLDDLAVIFLGLNWFVDLCPPAVVTEHRRSIRGETTKDDVVDAEYHVMDDKK